MIKEGDYWRCRMDMRHLHDLFELTTMAEGIDWHKIGETMSDRVGRKALEVQATALYDLFGVPVPPELRGSTLARLRHECRIIAATGGVMGAPVRVVGNLIWGLYRLSGPDSYKWQGGFDLAARVGRTFLGSPKGSRL
jgi:hypothetical protein